MSKASEPDKQNGTLFADSIRASSLNRLHQQAGQKTAPDQCHCVNLALATREPSTEDISLRGYFGTRPLIAFARAPWVMRPATSAGSLARIRILSSSASPGAIAVIAWLTVAAIMLVVQKSSKSTNVRWTVISRNSTASRPASIHKLRSASTPDTSERGGRVAVNPMARISACISSSGCPPPIISQT